MSCASVSRVVEEEIGEIRKRLLSRLPDLVFVAIVAAVEDCDDKPGALHVETQIATRQGFPREMRSEVMQSATDQVRVGKVQQVPS